MSDYKRFHGTPGDLMTISCETLVDSSMAIIKSSRSPSTHFQMNKQHHFTCKIKSTSFVNKQCSICHTRSFSGSLQPGTLNTYHHYCRHWHLTICLNYQSTPLPLSKFHKCPAIVFIIFNNWSGMSLRPVRLVCHSSISCGSCMICFRFEFGLDSWPLSLR